MLIDAEAGDVFVEPATTQKVNNNIAKKIKEIQVSLVRLGWKPKRRKRASDWHSRLSILK